MSIYVYIVLHTFPTHIQYICCSNINSYISNLAHSSIIAFLRHNLLYFEDLGTGGIYK